MCTVKNSMCIFVLALCLLVISACDRTAPLESEPVVPSDASEATLPADHLLVAVAHWPPWKIIEEAEFSGIDVDILEEIARRIGIAVEFVECPWARCLEMVKDGDVDMITSFGRTPEREAFVYYIEPPYVTANVVFYKRRSSSFSVLTYDDLHSFRIGTLIGSTYFDPFNTDPLLDKEEVAVDGQLPQMLASERIDLMIGWEIPMDYLIAQEGLSGEFEKVLYSSRGGSSYMAMSQKSELVDLIPRLSTVMQEMIEDGKVEEIIASYLEQAAPGGK